MQLGAGACALSWPRALAPVRHSVKDR